MRLVRVPLLALSIALLGAAAIPASALAGADVYYASPNGAPSGSACKNDESKPCSLLDAKEVAKGGDYVTLLPGTYAIPSAGFPVNKEISIGGKPGSFASTVIKEEGSGSIRETVTYGANLHDVTVEGAGGIQWNSGQVERVFVSYGGKAGACSMGQQVELLDSVCWAHGPSALSVAVDATVSGATDTVTLRNVTAYSSGAAGSAVRGEAAGGGNLTLVAKDVIAHSEANRDVSTLLNGGGKKVEALFADSSYATIDRGTGTTLTAPTEDGNTTAAPVFVNPAAGDFHEALASPTIDTGAITATELEESYEGETRLDLDGHARIQAKCLGGAPTVDIGGFESTPVDCTPPPPDNHFRFGKLKLNEKSGTATLVVTVPGPGTVKLTGKGLRSATWTAKGASSVRLPVVTAGKAKKALAKNGKRRVAPKVTFTPAGGTPYSMAHALVLHRVVR